jgi:hypothetical protein
LKRNGSDQVRQHKRSRSKPLKEKETKQMTYEEYKEHGRKQSIFKLSEIKQIGKKIKSRAASNISRPVSIDFNRHMKEQHFDDLETLEDLNLPDFNT